MAALDDLLQVVGGADQSASEPSPRSVLEAISKMPNADNAYWAYLHRIYGGSPAPPDVQTGIRPIGRVGQIASGVYSGAPMASAPPFSSDQPSNGLPPGMFMPPGGAQLAPVTPGMSDLAEKQRNRVIPEMTQPAPPRPSEAWDQMRVAPLNQMFFPRRIPLSNGTSAIWGNRRIPGLY